MCAKAHHPDMVMAMAMAMVMAMVMDTAMVMVPVTGQKRNVVAKRNH